jgi:hypothetical protein
MLILGHEAFESTLECQRELTPIYILGEAARSWSRPKRDFAGVAKPETFFPVNDELCQALFRTNDPSQLIAVHDLYWLEPDEKEGTQGWVAREAIAIKEVVDADK